MLISSLVGCALDRSLPEAPAAPAGLVRRTESGEELTPVFNDDGSFQYPLARDFDPTQRLTTDVLTMVYDGQARLTADPVPWKPFTYTFEADHPPETGLDALLGLVHLDREGHVWRVEDVDVEAWIASVYAENERMRALGEDVPLEAYDPVNRVIDYTSGHSRGDVITVAPLSWSTGCTDVEDDHIWDSESRVQVDNLISRQRATVTINTYYSGAIAVCSGVMLTDVHVLTAAHCVHTCVDGVNNDSFWTVGRVCAWGNAYDADASGTDDPECSTFSQITLDDDGYDDVTDCDDNDDWDSAHDWVVIELDTPMTVTTDFDTSTLSSISNTREVKSLGYPANVPGSGDCDPNDADPVYNPSPPNAYYNSGDWLYLQNNVDITDFNGAVAKAKMDAMNGQSGSPVYYCSGSDDVCDPGEKGIVAMVVSAWEDAANDRIIGPRIPAVRDEILDACGL